MYLQNCDNVYDLVWTVGPQGVVTYGDVFPRTSASRAPATSSTPTSRSSSTASTPAAEAEAGRGRPAARPTTRCASPATSFNLPDARRAISVTERQRYILRVRKLAQAVAEAYFAQREKLGFLAWKVGPGVSAKPTGRRPRRRKIGHAGSVGATRPGRRLPREARMKSRGMSVAAIAAALLSCMGIAQAQKKAPPPIGALPLDKVVEMLDRNGNGCV